MKTRIRSAVLGMQTALGIQARPAFLLLGAQKSGTTALHAYLSAHPRLVSAKEKEVGFFSPGMTRTWPDHPDFAELSRFAALPGDAVRQAAAERWYAGRFPIARPWRDEVMFEATPEYLYFPETAARIRAYRPDMKLIVLLRDPVDRAYSAWNMHRSFDQPGYRSLRDDRSFEQAIEEELAEGPQFRCSTRACYLDRGLYAKQLRRFYRHFPAEQILVLDTAELRSSQARVLARVCRFLGVAPMPSGGDAPPVLEGSYAAPLSAHMREKLAQFFAPHNARLFDLLGRRFEWTRPSDPGGLVLRMPDASGRHSAGAAEPPAQRRISLR